MSTKPSPGKGALAVWSCASMNMAVASNSEAECSSLLCLDLCSSSQRRCETFCEATTGDDKRRFHFSINSNTEGAF